MHRFIAMLITLLPLAAMGQSYNSSSDKPFWADGYFRECENSYLEVVNAYDYDLEGAKQKAIREVMKRRSIATGTETSVSIDNNNVTVSDRDLIVKARIVDEFVLHTTSGYTVYLLVQTAKNPTFSYEPVTISDEYKFSARAFIPGMAQIYKGSKAKGYSIIAAQALSIGSIIVCENQRAAYVKKMKEQPKFAKEYNSKAQNWKNGRNVSIGVAAGIWLYSFIDGAVAKGTKRIKVGKADRGELSVLPYTDFDAAGVAVAYRF